MSRLTIASGRERLFVRTAFDLSGQKRRNWQTFGIRRAAIQGTPSPWSWPEALQQSPIKFAT
jgi:hypothetical protein